MTKLHTFKTIMIVFIGIGVFGIALNAIWGSGAVVFLRYEEINGIGLYKMDIWGYINNIQTQLKNVSILQLSLPTRVWLTGNFFDVAVNNLAVMLDYVIMIGNVLLYPLRLGGYILQTYLTILGLDLINPTQNMQWLTNLLNSLATMQFNYV